MVPRCVQGCQRCSPLLLHHRGCEGRNESPLARPPGRVCRPPVRTALLEEEGDDPWGDRSHCDGGPHLPDAQQGHPDCPQSLSGRFRAAACQRSRCSIRREPLRRHTCLPCRSTGVTCVLGPRPVPGARKGGRCSSWERDRGDSASS